MLELGIEYLEVPMTADLRPDIPGIQKAVQMHHDSSAMIQRSRGYSVRAALTVQEIGEIIAKAKEANPNIWCL